MLQQEGGTPGVVVTPVTSEQTTTVTTIPVVFKPKEVDKPVHEIVGPPNPPSLKKETKKEAQVKIPAPIKTTTTVKVPPKVGPGIPAKHGWVAPLLVSVGIMGWWIANVIFKKPKAKPVEPEPVVEPIIQPEATATSPKKEDMIVLVSSSRGRPEEPRTNGYRFRSFSDDDQSPYRKAQDGFDDKRRSFSDQYGKRDS